ncbi:hypothetical protein EOD23_21310 [Mesorhizobium sp. USDA-HM6]|nr:hypothetical protein EOD23_21310 [Mesorhizobium sp. USDA-HM6]
MSPRSVQRFWDNDMHQNLECMSPRSVQRFWDNDMHQNLESSIYRLSAGAAGTARRRGTARDSSAGSWRSPAAGCRGR